jgi:TPR repeat protein
MLLIYIYFKDKAKYGTAANDLFVIAASLGDRTAQYNIGRKRFEGDEVKHDEEIGKCWLEKSAAQENVQALFYLGTKVYSNTDFKRANENFLKASQLEYAPAQCSYGVSLIKGRGVAKNVSEAAKYFELAVKNGSQKCATNLILLYSEGYDTETDFCAARSWMKYPHDITAIGEKELKAIESISNCD